MQITINVYDYILLYIYNIIYIYIQLLPIGIIYFLLLSWCINANTDTYQYSEQFYVKLHGSSSDRRGPDRQGTHQPPEENVEGSSCPSDIVGMCWEQAWKYGLRNSWKFTFYIILPRNIRKTTGTHGDSTWFRIGDCHAMHWRSRQAVSQSLQLPQLGTGCVVSCCVLG